METDIGQPFQYTPPSKDEEEDSTPLTEEDYQPQPQVWEQAPPPPPPYYHQPMMHAETTTTQKFDLGSLDKNTLVIAFAVFLLGFFMGKTMQPVILRSH